MKKRVREVRQPEIEAGDPRLIELCRNINISLEDAKASKKEVYDRLTEHEKFMIEAVTKKN